MKKPAKKKPLETAVRKNGLRARLGVLQGEIAELVAQLKIAQDIAAVRMSRINSLTVEHDEFALSVAATIRCYEATKLFWPLHLREAIRTRDIEAVKQDTARIDAVHKEWLEAFHRVKEVERELAELKSKTIVVDVANRIAALEAFIAKSLHDGQINCTEASELLGKK